MSTFSDKVKQHTHGIAHIAVSVQDIEKSIRFYEDFGFTVQYRKNFGGSFDIACIQLDNLMLELLQNGGGSSIPSALDHFAIETKDVDGLYEEFAKRDYTFLTRGVQAMDFWENGVRFFYIAGPDGERIEFLERVGM